MGITAHDYIWLYMRTAGMADALYHVVGWSALEIGWQGPLAEG